MGDPLATISTRRTDQRERTPGRTNEVRNSAGGYVHEVDRWKQLERFLILGTTGGTYYVTEQQLTKQNAGIVLECLDEDFERTVRLIVDISVNGRAPKPKPAIFALAAAAGHDNPECRAMALAHLNEVCRTGTHLFTFLGYVENFRGWGRALRRAVAEWYTDKSAMQVAYQVTKYRQREGWSHRDALRLAKPRPERGSDLDKVLAYAVGKPVDFDETEDYSGARYCAITDLLAQDDEVKVALARAGGQRFPWEVFNSKLLREPKLWEKLAPEMGLMALVRNLGRMTDIGFIKPGGMTDQNTRVVIDRLTDPTDITRSRIHPLQLLLAEATYGRGQGFRGGLSWTPNTDVMDALDDAFYASFGNVVPSGKATLVGLDISGSMWGGGVAGTSLRPAEAAAALALMWRHTEEECSVMAFTHTFEHFPISKKDTLQSVYERSQIASRRMGPTDCALPMIFARENNLAVEHFIVVTDSETWAGREKPAEALKSYRQKMGIDARLSVIAMTANRFSIADPRDAGMLDVVGFDAATPALVADFARG